MTRPAFLSLFTCLLLGASAARAGIVQKYPCVIFTDGGGAELNRICSGSSYESRKAAAPVSQMNKTWDSLTRLASTQLYVIAYSQRAMAWVRNYNEFISARSPTEKDPHNMTLSTRLGSGYRIRFYDAAGKLLWDKVIQDGMAVREAKLSYDGSTLVLYVEPEAGYGPPPAGPAVFPRLLIYGKSGELLADFPPRKEICRPDFIKMHLWISRTGKYVMTTCGKGNSFFLQPKARLYWDAGKPYVLDNYWNSRFDKNAVPWSDEDEEFGRLDKENLEIIVPTAHGANHDPAPTGLTLNGGDWRRLEDLK